MASWTTPLEGFFDWFGAARSAALYFVCSDMWKPYLKVVAERAGQAVQVLDRFHIMSHFSQAIDEVRAAEARKLAAEGRAPVLKHSRWLLLKRPENLTDGQAERLAELVRRNLRTVRAYLLKEDFQRLWGYVSPYWAGRFLDRWCTRTMRSRLEPMKDVARMVRSHRDLILNWFPRRVVHRRAVDAQQRALAPDAQRAAPLDQLQACGAAQRCKPRRKKSRSTVNSPIFACKSRIVASCSESRDALPPAKTSSSPSTAWRFHAPTWFG